MNTTNHRDNPVVTGLSAPVPSTRLRAAMTAGTQADPQLLAVLLERCAAEEDFFVRDMLTWALCRLPAEITVPALTGELRSPVAQARSQALHTLSKIGDEGTWPAVSALLHDPDDEVARSAWRAAVVLVPADAASTLATELVRELGRGDEQLQLSLSRAFVGLGEITLPVVRSAMTTTNPRVRAHAEATERLCLDPDGGFHLSVEFAKRTVAIGQE